MRASGFTWQTLPYIHKSFATLDPVSSPLSSNDELITWLFNDLLTNITEYVGKHIQPTFNAEDGFGNCGLMGSFYSLSESGQEQTLRSNHCFTFALRPKTIRKGAKSTIALRPTTTDSCRSSSAKFTATPNTLVPTS